MFSFKRHIYSGYRVLKARQTGKKRREPRSVTLSSLSVENDATLWLKMDWEVLAGDAVTLRGEKNIALNGAFGILHYFCE